MLRKFRGSLLIAAVVLAALTAVFVHIAVERFAQEPPNYSKIEEGSWLGGSVSEPPPGTQAVLNLCESEDRYRVSSHRWEPIRDAAPAPSLEWLQKQVTFIASERAAGHTLFIHCRNGVSRSGMMMAAYLMEREGWSREQALEFLRSRRPGVRPNPVFMELLWEWEEKVKKGASRRLPLPLQG